MQPNYTALYRALVTSVADPTNLGKIRVQCPQVAGLAEIRSAEPANAQMPVPAVGSTVWIGFSGGDITKPFYFSNSSFVVEHPNGSVSVESVATTALPDPVRALWVGGLDSQITGTFNTPAILVTDENGTSAADIVISGSLIKGNTTGFPYTWQTPSYNSGWSASTTFNGTTNWHAVQYRLDTEDNVVVIGAFKCTSASPTTAIFNLPGIYMPASQWPVFISRNRGGTITSIPAVITGSGNFDIIAAISGAPANGDEYLVNTIVPIGNLS